MLRQGLDIARRKGLARVLLNINAQNGASIHVCEKPGGVLMDTIIDHSQTEGDYEMRRYVVELQVTDQAKRRQNARFCRPFHFK